MRYYSFTKRGRNGGGIGTGPAPAICAECGDALHRSGLTTGYGSEFPAQRITADAFAALTGEPAPVLKPGEYLEMSRAVCFDCCGRNDRAEMIRTGRAVLYLSGRRITNWPGTLDIECSAVSRSQYGGGFGAPRVDAWFTGPDGMRWHAVNRGKWSQIAHCRRLKA